MIPKKSGPVVIFRRWEEILIKHRGAGLLAGLAMFHFLIW